MGGELQFALPAAGRPGPGLEVDDVCHVDETRSRQAVLSRQSGAHDLLVFSCCLAAFSGRWTSGRLTWCFVPATICPCGLTPLDKNGLHA